MQITLTHFRQNLFALADEVARTGEALLIERRGVRLKLVRDDSQAPLQIGRLARLQVQELTVGNPLHPAESPARWSDEPHPATALQAAEPAAPLAPPTGRARRPRR